MTIEITGPPETLASGPPDGLQQNGVQTQIHASAMITNAEVPLGTAGATGLRRKQRRWVALLRGIFVAAPKQARRKRRPYPPPMAYLELARMAREMKRL